MSLPSSPKYSKPLYDWFTATTTNGKKVAVKDVYQIWDYMVDTSRWGLARRSQRLLVSMPPVTPSPVSPPPTPRAPSRSSKASLDKSDSGRKDSSTENATWKNSKPESKGPPRLEPTEPSISPVARTILRAPRNFPKPEYTCLFCGHRADSRHCTIQCYARFRELHLDPAAEKIELRQTERTGLGAFVKAGCAIDKDDWIGEYLGELVPPSASEAETSRYAFTLPGVPGEEGVGEVVIDAQTHGNWTRFFNSHCVPNVSATSEQVGKVRIVAFRALRRIEAREQLLIFFGRQYFAERGMLCCCDAQAEPHLPPEEEEGNGEKAR